MTIIKLQDSLDARILIRAANWVGDAMGNKNLKILEK